VHTCNHDIVNVFRRTPLGQIIIDSTSIIDVEKAAFWPAEETRIVLNRISFCWGVDDGEHLLQVILDQLLKLDFEWLDSEGLSMHETLPKYLETKATTRTP
jgi:hypothetical protein